MKRKYNEIMSRWIRIDRKWKGISVVMISDRVQLCSDIPPMPIDRDIMSRCGYHFNKFSSFKEIGSP